MCKLSCRTAREWFQVLSPVNSRSTVFPDCGDSVVNLFARDFSVYWNTLWTESGSGGMCTGSCSETTAGDVTDLASVIFSVVYVCVCVCEWWEAEEQHVTCLWICYFRHYRKTATVSRRSLFEAVGLCRTTLTRAHLLLIAAELERKLQPNLANCKRRIRFC